MWVRVRVPTSSLAWVWGHLAVLGSRGRIRRGSVSTMIGDIGALVRCPGDATGASDFALVTQPVHVYVYVVTKDRGRATSRFSESTRKPTRSWH